MKKLLSLFLACILLLGILPTSVFAADSVEEALGEVNIYNGDYELGYHPSLEDYRQLRQMASDYVETFRIQVPAKDHGPKLVYICAPLRGEVEKNIEFARQKAQEVFQAGDIPVCPHLMFPPIADPGNPVQDQAAREMGLRLVEKCQQVNVYGPVTEGMWAEIHRANKLDIPVVTDLKTKGRTSPRRKKSAKREEVK